MKKYQSSLTAQGIAILRAMESEKPAGRRICYDPYARFFVNPVLTAFIRVFAALGYTERRGPGVWEFLTARDRYIDDYLQARIYDGIQQLVILGAGFDSRAYRFDELCKTRVFEVDHPATQTVKVAKVKRLFHELPGHVTYVPVDFETETLADRLFASGYSRDLKTLFIWQGVIYYLTPEAADSTLGFVANNSGAGSSLVFDYVFKSVLDGTVKRGEAVAMRRNSRWSGESMRFGIEEGQIEAYLGSRGFQHIQNVTAADLNDLYFTGVNASRTVAPVYAIASAAVA